MQDDDAVAIALDALDPALSAIADALHSEGVPDPLVASVFASMAEAYALGHADGARQATAEIAPLAALHGLHLRLGPRLRRPAWPVGGPASEGRGLSEGGPL